MKVSTSVSNSEKLPTWPLRGSGNCRDECPCPRQSMVATAKPRCAQLVHRLEIFFDELAAPGEDADRSLGIGGESSARSVAIPIRCPDLAGYGTVGTGIAGSENELHGAATNRSMHPCNHCFQQGSRTPWNTGQPAVVQPGIGRPPRRGRILRCRNRTSKRAAGPPAAAEASEDRRRKASPISLAAAGDMKNTAQFGRRGPIEQVARDGDDAVGEVERVGRRTQLVADSGLLPLARQPEHGPRKIASERTIDPAGAQNDVVAVGSGNGAFAPELAVAITPSGSVGSSSR